MVIHRVFSVECIFTGSPSLNGEYCPPPAPSKASIKSTRKHNTEPLLAKVLTVSLRNEGFELMFSSKSLVDQSELAKEFYFN